MAMASSAALAGNGAALGSAFAGAKVAVPAQRTVAAKGGASSVSCSLGHAADSRAFALKSFQGKQAFKAVPSPPVSRQADWLVILAIQLRGLISCPVPRSFLGRNGGCGKGYPGVIAGLQNFDAENVKSIVAAAQAGGATLIDIACDPELVRLALGVTSLPVCVSAIEPEAFVAAVEAGAHMVEIGNFDSFYSSGRKFTADEVVALTQRTRALLPGIALSVTVPHTLALAEQVELAEALQANGADIIQTEGGTSTQPSSSGVMGLVEKATPTLAAAYSISRAVQVPVMCASGLSSVTVPLAFAAGASGVGVGSAINKLGSPIEMVAAVRCISEAVQSTVTQPATLATKP